MYSIYHIPGVKIGCSKRVSIRVKEQGYTNYEVLETHTEISIARKREIELQKIYGYKVDKGTQLYSEKFSKIGSKGGNALLQKLGTEHFSNAGRIGGKNSRYKNHNDYKKHLDSIRTKEGCILGGKKGGATNVNSGHIERMRQKSNLKLGGKVAGTIVGNREHTCIHCGYTMKGNGFFRYHNDNCKY